MPIRVSRKEFRRVVIPQDDADISWMDKEDLDDYKAGFLEFYCVRAAVEFDIPVHGGIATVKQEIETAGIWDVCVDSRKNEDGFDEWFKSECLVLEEMLGALHVEVID